MDSDDSTCLSSDFFSLTGKPSSAADFPTHFPFDFTPFPVHSVLSSATTADNVDDDEEHFLAALTQRLTQSTLRGPHKLASLHESHAKTAMAGSPQSTLSGFGSWSGWSSVSSDGSPNGPSQAPSPPATPYGGVNNTSDLIYAAAEQVARLKMNTNCNGPIGSTLIPSKTVSSIENVGFYSYASQFGTELPINKPESCFNWGRQVKVENQQIHGRGGDFHSENGRFVARTDDFPQYTWPSRQPHHRRNPSQPCAPVVPAAFHVGGAAPKKECAGTGVFLPRRYDNNSLQSHNRTDSGSIALFPGKNIHDINRPVPQRTWNGRVPSSNGEIFKMIHKSQDLLNGKTDALMIQRNAIISQQRLSNSRPAERGNSHEFLLPQEWTY